MFKRFSFFNTDKPQNIWLHFQARSVRVDNPTNLWLSFSGIREFVQPWTMGVVKNIDLADTFQYEWQAPAGLVNPPLIANQFASLVFDDRDISPSPGVAVSGPRAQYLDRTALPITRSSDIFQQAQVAVGTQWTYTVPATRIAYIEVTSALVKRVYPTNGYAVAAPVSGIDSAAVVYTPVSTGVGVTLVEASLIQNNDIGASDRDVIAFLGWIDAGDILQGNRRKDSTSGVTRHRTVLKLTEFDK